MTRFLSKKDLREIIRLSPTQVDRLERDKLFPKRVSVGFRVFWVADEVEEWMQRRISSRDKPHSAPR